MPDLLVGAGREARPAAPAAAPADLGRLRHRLRRLWVCPEFLADEVEDILEDLGLSDNATLFMSDEVRGRRTTREAVAGWWDLPSIAALHDAFLAAHENQVQALGPDPTPQQAFAAWTRGLDSWRTIPYLDPGLAPEVLPDDWPGQRSIPIFLELRDRIQPLAQIYVEQVTSVLPSR